MSTPNTTLTITLDDIQGSIIGTSANPAYVEFALVNYGPFLPRIIGTAMVAKVGPYLIPFVGSLITESLWSNDQITPAGTYYAISILDDKKNVLLTGAYAFTGTVSADLSTLAQSFPSLGPSVSGALVTLNFSSTPQFNGILVRGDVAFDLTLTGNVSSSTAIGFYPGQLATFIITQDAVGGRTFVYPTNVFGAGAINLTPNKTTVQTFVARFNGNLYPIGPATYSP